MENDIISRSALIAELEAFKMSLGDIVLRFVVDRVIDLVKNFKGIEMIRFSYLVASEEKACQNCRHLHTSGLEEPCLHCGTFKNWEPKA
jgi:hypothetical protein